MRYFLALGYQNIDGLYKNTDKDRDVNSNLNFQKFNYRANIDARLGKIFDVAASVGGDISDRYTPNYSTETLWTNMVKYPPMPFRPGLPADTARSSIPTTRSDRCWKRDSGISTTGMCRLPSPSGKI